LRGQAWPRIVLAVRSGSQVALIAWYSSRGASAQATMPGRNVTGRQPYFPDVPGLTVALLPGIAARLARSRPLRFAPLISGCHPANVQLNW
jgi:hypothetical protein